MTQLEKDIIQTCQDNKLYQPFQVGGYIISPILWGEPWGEEKEIQIDRETMMEEFAQTLDVLDLNLLTNEQ